MLGEWGDSNPRPSEPQSDALTKLSYILRFSLKQECENNWIRWYMQAIAENELALIIVQVLLIHQTIKLASFFGLFLKATNEN